MSFELRATSFVEQNYRTLKCATQQKLNSCNTADYTIIIIEPYKRWETIGKFLCVY